MRYEQAFDLEMRTLGPRTGLNRSFDSCWVAFAVKYYLFQNESKRRNLFLGRIVKVGTAARFNKGLMSRVVGNGPSREKSCWKKF